MHDCLFYEPSSVIHDTIKKKTNLRPPHESTISKRDHVFSIINFKDKSEQNLARYDETKYSGNRPSTIDV
jgi:hypothetical protein